MPTNVCELHFFLGFVNVYGDFIDKQTVVTACLYDLTAARKRIKHIYFIAENLKRFNKINCWLCTAPRRAYANVDALYTLYTNASNIDVGAVYFQHDASKVEPAIFFLKKFCCGAETIFDV